MDGLFVRRISDKQVSLQTIFQIGESLLGFVVFHADGKGLFCSHHHHQFPAPCDSGVNQVALQQWVIMGRV